MQAPTGPIRLGPRGFPNPGLGRSGGQKTEMQLKSLDRVAVRPVHMGASGRLPALLTPFAAQPGATAELCQKDPRQLTVAVAGLQLEEHEGFSGGDKEAAPMVRLLMLSLLSVLLGGCRDSVVAPSLAAPQPSPTGAKASASPTAAPPAWSVTLEQRYGRGAYDAGGGNSTTITSDGLQRSRRGWMTIAGGHGRHFEGPVAHPEKLQALEEALRDPELRQQAGQKLMATNSVGWTDETSLTFELDGASTTLRVDGDGLPGAAGRAQAAMGAVSGDRVTEPDLHTPADTTKVPPVLRWRVTLSQKAPSVESGWQSRSFWVDALGNLYVSYATAGRDDVYTYSAGPQLKPDQLAALGAAVAKAPFPTGAAPPVSEAAEKPVWLKVYHCEQGVVGAEPGKPPLVTVSELLDEAFADPPLEQPWAVHPDPPPLPPEAQYPEIPTGEALEKAKLSAAGKLRSNSPFPDGRVPLYRLFLQAESEADSSHLLLASPQEVAQLTQGGPGQPNSQKRTGFVDQGIIGCLPGGEKDGSVPLYHIGSFHHRRVDNIYTIDAEQARRLRGYRFASIMGFAFPTQIEGTIPVYSYSNGKTHLYLSDRAESERLSAEGWKSEGVAFCLFPPAQP